MELEHGAGRRARRGEGGVYRVALWLSWKPRQKCQKARPLVALDGARVPEDPAPSSPTRMDECTPCTTCRSSVIGMIGHRPRAVYGDVERRERARGGGEGLAFKLEGGPLMVRTTLKAHRLVRTACALRQLRSARAPPARPIKTSRGVAQTALSFPGSRRRGVAAALVPLPSGAIRRHPAP